MTDYMLPHFITDTKKLTYFFPQASWLAKDLYKVVIVYILLPLIHEIVFRCFFFHIILG